MGKFLRIFLPLILLAVFVIITLFIINSVETMDLMETSKRAGPTLLNR